MNVFSFTGNLGNQAEKRYTQSGDSIVSFSVAVKSGFGDKAVTTWVRCTMFGKRGESVFPYLNKGQLVGVSGEFSAREWDDKEGNKRTSIEVRVNDLTLLGGKPEGQQDQHQSQKQQTKTVSHGDGLDSDVPF